MQKIFKGTATALITPFKDDAVDYASLDRLLDAQIAGGVNALVINGTTGEPTTMTHKERTKAAKFVLKKLGGRIPIILGAGSNNTYTAVEYAIEAQKLGADAVLAVTPYYNKATQGGIIAHYKAIADAISIPVIMYNVPARTGLNMLPQTVKALCGYKNISAVKEASGKLEQMTEIKALCGDAITVYSGDDALAFGCLDAGGDGVISVASNIVPKHVVELTDSYFAGDTKKARGLQNQMRDLVDALFCEVNPIPVKTAAYLLGLIDSDYMRLPMTKMEKVDVLKKALTEFGLTLKR